jgi:hypothetical protein
MGEKIPHTCRHGVVLGMKTHANRCSQAHTRYVTASASGKGKATGSVVEGRAHTRHIPARKSV